jgi:glutaminase
MTTETRTNGPAMAGYVSTGHLPAGEQVMAHIREAHARYRDNDEGDNASHYPALARVPRHLFGICVESVTGEQYAVGDTECHFTTMSIAKPFTLALVLEAIGADELRARVGLNATGQPFASVVAIELHPQHLTNPMVNSGALAAISLIPGETADDKWQFILDGLSRFAGRRLALNEEVYASASATNYRNQGISRILYDHHRLYFDPVGTTEVYTKQSCLNVTTRDVAIMAATLANGGVNPHTGERVVDARHCPHVLAAMTTAGLYEASGDWLFDMGVPGKSGVGGGIMTVSPGKGGLGVFSPPLDRAGNSIRGQLAAKFLSQKLGLNLFISSPAD